jgi:phosphoribosylformylglycinamidine synthase
MVAMGGNLGMDIHLDTLPTEDCDRDDQVLFSESAGRFIISVSPDKSEAFEAIFADRPSACIGTVTESSRLRISGLNTQTIIDISVSKLKQAWKATFGALI